MSEFSKILIVDDDKRLARTLKDILSISGFQAMEAHSSEAAIHQILKDPPDCVITDIRMPGMDGVDLFRSIHDRLPDLPVILMTAYSSDERIQEGIKAGALGVITKPLEINQLLGFLSALRNDPVIAVVDDDPNFCRTIDEILSNRGYQVKTITSSGKVIENLNEEMGCVLLDMKFNSVGGKAMLEEIRAIYPDLPVVLITGYRAEVAEAIEDALKMNAYVCLYKPLEFSKLFETLNEIRIKQLRLQFTD